MNNKELDARFAANKRLLETAYLAGREPWQQSGFGLHHARTYDDWVSHRKPIADALSSSGTFLDIGCANGFLLECLLPWSVERGLTILPFGLDLSEQLVALARRRLPSYAHHLFAGNAWDWIPPRRFDYVRTELVYVPDHLQGEYVARILDRYLTPGGRLLAAEYRSRQNTVPTLSIDRDLEALGYAVEAVHLGQWQGVEKTRVAVIKKPG